jgi:hypothetical protein
MSKSFYFPIITELAFIIATTSSPTFNPKDSADPVVILATTSDPLTSSSTSVETGPFFMSFIMPFNWFLAESFII